MVNCGWRRTKNKKGGSVWIEKASAPVFANNLVYDCRYGMKQPKKDGANLKDACVAPNYYYASTQTGVDQMSKTADLIIWNDNDIKSQVPGQLNPLFKAFTQNPAMNINCEVDDASKGAPLPYDRNWNFNVQAGSPALSGGKADIARIFEYGLAFFGMKRIQFANSANDQNYYFAAPAPSTRFGAQL